MAPGVCLLAAGLLAVLLTGCSSLWRAPTIGQDEYERTALAAAGELDVIARDLEEYGALTASASAVIRSPGDSFKFNLDLTAKDILQHNRRQGFSASRQLEELALRLAASYSLLRAGKTDQANAVLAGQAAAATAAPAAPAAAAAPTAGSGDAAGTGAGDAAPKPPKLPDAEPRATPTEFTKPLDVPNPETLDISFRDLIKRVFDDHTTLKVFEWMSQPKPGSLGDNMNLFASVLTVSMRPGRETYRGYIGEIDLRLSYAADCRGVTGGKIEQGNPHPVSFAVFPAIDTQVLDLRTSIRSQFALSLLLEALFPQGGASAGADLRRRFEQDAATVSAINQVAGYNASGRNFGWRFSPSFVAQADPAAAEAGPGNLLQPQSFPALVLFLADKQDLIKAVGGSRDESERDNECRRISKLGGRHKGPYDHLMLFYASRWMRAPSPAADTSWWPLSGEWNRFVRPRFSEQIPVEWGFRLAKARQSLDRLRTLESTAGVLPYASNAVANRLNSLEALSVGANIFFPLPREAEKTPPSALGVSEVSPSQGWIDAETVFVVRGRGFEANKTRFYVAGREARILHLSAKGTEAVIAFAPPVPRPAGTKADLAVFWADGGSAILKEAITFAQAKPPAAETAKGRLELQWDTGPGGQQVLKTMAVYGNVSPSEVLKAVSAKPGGSDVDVNVNVNASEQKR